MYKLTWIFDFSNAQKSNVTFWQESLHHSSIPWAQVSLGHDFSFDAGWHIGLLGPSRTALLRQMNCLTKVLLQAAQKSCLQLTDACHGARKQDEENATRKRPLALPVSEPRSS